MQVTDTSIASGRMLTCWQCRHPWICLEILLVLIFSGGPTPNSGGSTDGGWFNISPKCSFHLLSWASSLVSLIPYLFLTNAFVVVVLPLSYLYVIECFNVSFTTCRLCSKSKFFHAFRFVLLTALVHFVVFNTLLFFCLVLLVSSCRSLKFFYHISSLFDLLPSTSIFCALVAESLLFPHTFGQQSLWWVYVCVILLQNFEYTELIFWELYATF